MTQLNLEHWWQPFTNVRAFRDNPRLFSRAEGCFLYTDDGRDVLDITAGLWCANLGHGRQEVADAVSRQLMTLDFAPPFQFGHEVSFRFAEQLAKLAPEGLNRVFFTNSGSESVDTAIKIAYQYQRARGKASKTRFIARERGYHGINMGGTSLQGLPNNRKGFPVYDQVDFLPDLLDIERNAFSRGLPEHGTDRMEAAFNKLVAQRGAENICAVIVEPCVGAGGMVPPPQGYLQRLRELCDQHDILLIFDEVVTGFGRTGAPFAAQSMGVTPDLITCAKAINGGTVPMGGVFVREAIQQVIFDAAPAGGPELFHGNTYAGNPVSSAAGLAALEIYQREALLTRAAGPIGQYWEDALHGLRDLDCLIDIRNFGLLGAITFAADSRFPAGPAVPVHNQCFKNGLLCRGVGDTLVMSPPLTISEQEIDLFIERLRRSIGEVIG
ncbi:aminotransferase class III-fold pyridoxal phosphate-dependent enzyme [Aestuariirhabdus litorea]|uniref:Aminotransferase class III-fold pyridoxal phosphate-dependent enzyme n=1 Tax=Aestuariirhabdus litorea TaxID=2528527 RepID=A0A3P3VS79_9GAMM|nr:aminotransferase class III-fold pyridoxal phosphate-dependent enzyme [Aestuariirhabdus litorea]RRJ84359.1 aminotransferase class III-fold pyridoxal phosphate-dependent enzyme [Aestuariirhabdus litorea]RWW97582.1 aminotransferase class III-fold pyridoxal phosphate-dependent enzyme [Endozoicomonadaceae bacterium GTF-13]